MKSGRTLASILTVGVGVGARASNQLVVFFVTIVATRFLGPSDFGVFAVAAACVTLVRVMLYTGAFEYLLKAPDAKAASSECLIVNFAAATAMSALLLVFALVANRIFGTPLLRSVLLLMIPSNFIATFTAWQESMLLRGTRIHAYYIVTIVTEVASGIIAVLLFRAHWGIGALIAQTYARTVCQGLAYLAIQRPIFSARLCPQTGIEIVRWSLSRYSSAIVGFFFNYGADFVLGIFLSTAATGLYRAGNRIVSAITDIFAQPARTFAITLFCRRAAQNESIDDLWPKILTATLVAGWPALVGFASISGSVVPLLLGQKWLAVAPVVSIFCLSRMAGLLGAVTSPLLIASDRQGSLLIYQIIGSLSTLLLLVLFAHFGLQVAALCVAFCSVTVNLWQFRVAMAPLPAVLPRLLSILPIVLIPTLSTAVGAQISIALGESAGHPGKWLLTVFVVAGGLFAWLLSSYFFRRQIFQSVRALAGG